MWFPHPHFHQLERRSPGGHLLAQDSKVTPLLRESPQYCIRPCLVLLLFFHGAYSCLTTKMLITVAKAGAVSPFWSPSQLLAQALSKCVTWWRGDLCSRIRCSYDTVGVLTHSLGRPHVVGEILWTTEPENWVCLLAVWPKGSHLTSLSLRSL